MMDFLNILPFVNEDPLELAGPNSDRMNHTNITLKKDFKNCTMDFLDISPFVNEHP